MRSRATVAQLATPEAAKHHFDHCEKKLLRPGSTTTAIYERSSTSNELLTTQTRLIVVAGCWPLSTLIDSPRSCQSRHHAPATANRLASAAQLLPVVHGSDPAALLVASINSLSRWAIERSQARAWPCFRGDRGNDIAVARGRQITTPPCLHRHR